MTDVFFTATKRSLNNITSNYDMVWPTAVGLWNLRCMVNGVKKEFPEITEAELAAKFSQGSGIHGVNYQRAFIQTMLHNSFYSTYLGKRDRCYAQLDALLHCYRVFKEARNCYMHNGSIADQKLINAYTDYLPFATASSLCVSEVPDFPAPALGTEVQVSLRGVVGFSYILIKLLVSLDTELLCAADAEAEFIARYQQKHLISK